MIFVTSAKYKYKLQNYFCSFMKIEVQRVPEDGADTLKHVGYLHYIQYC